MPNLFAEMADIFKSDPAFMVAKSEGKLEGLSMNVAVLGASNKPERYSFKAVRMLREKGHTPYPVLPALPEVDGIPVSPSLRAIPDPIHTITVYLSARNQQSIADQLLNSGAHRVIFNPGAENPALAEQLTQRGKEVLHDCTLVLLATGQFTPGAPEVG
jgi:predicted CoA-binding protein